MWLLRRSNCFHSPASLYKLIIAGFRKEYSMYSTAQSVKCITFHLPFSHYLLAITGDRNLEKIDQYGSKSSDPNYREEWGGRERHYPALLMGLG